MPVKAFDHVAIPTADAERFLEYYKRLGFTFINEEKWRRGESPIFSLRIGEHNMINVHPEGFTANLRGQTAEPGLRRPLLRVGRHRGRGAGDAGQGRRGVRVRAGPALRRPQRRGQFLDQYLHRRP